MSCTVRLVALAAVLALALPALAQDASLESEDQKLAYTLGAEVARQMNIPALGLTGPEIDAMALGFADIARMRAGRVPDSYRGKVAEFRNRRIEGAYEAEVRASSGFLEERRRQEGVQKRVSGLLIETVSEGAGLRPGPNSLVRVHYEGTLRDGRTFDSSIARGKPQDLKVNGVIKCWTEALQEMKVGGRSRLYCPSSLAYGRKGAAPLIRPGAALVFDVELIEIVTP